MNKKGLLLKSIFFFFRYLLLIHVIGLYLITRQAVLSVHCMFHYKSISKWLDSRVGKISHYILKMAHVLIGFRLTVWNIERFQALPANTSYLTVSNHQSLCDILALLHLFVRVPAKFILKKSLSRGVPLASAVIRMHKHIAINRKVPKQSIAAIKRLATSMKTKEAHSNVVVFAEGTRSRDKNLLPFKTAAIRTILHDNPLPIVVIALHNGYKFRSFTNYRYIPKTNYYIRLLQVLHPTPHDIQGTITKARAMIQKQLDEWEEYDMWRSQHKL